MASVNEVREWAEQRKLALRLRALGWSLWEVGEQVGCTGTNMWRMQQGPARRPLRHCGPRPARVGFVALVQREAYIVLTDRRVMFFEAIRSTGGPGKHLASFAGDLAQVAVAA